MNGSLLYNFTLSYQMPSEVVRKRTFIIKCMLFSDKHDQKMFISNASRIATLNILRSYLYSRCLMQIELCGLTQYLILYSRFPGQWWHVLDPVQLWWGVYQCSELTGGVPRGHDWHGRSWAGQKPRSHNVGKEHRHKNTQTFLQVHMYTSFTYRRAL